MIVTRVLVAAVAAIALTVPPANAGAVAFDCGSDLVGQRTGGQHTATGMAYGYVVSDTLGQSVSIRCYVRVDGVDQDSTATGSGVNTAVTAGQLTLSAGAFQQVDFCGDWTAGGTHRSFCTPFCPTCLILPGGAVCVWAPCGE